MREHSHPVPSWQHLSNLQRHSTTCLHSPNLGQHACVLRTAGKRQAACMRQLQAAPACAGGAEAGAGRIPAGPHPEQRQHTHAPDAGGHGGRGARLWRGGRLLPWLAVYGRCPGRPDAAPPAGRAPSAIRAGGAARRCMHAEGPGTRWPRLQLFRLPRAEKAGRSLLAEGVCSQDRLAHVGTCRR